MPIFLVGPCLIGLQPQVLPVLLDPDAALVQGQDEILMLKRVIKIDLAGVHQVAGIDDTNAGPVGGAHAHGTAGPADIYFISNEHSGPFGHRIRGSLGTGHKGQCALVLIFRTDGGE